MVVCGLVGGWFFDSVFNVFEIRFVVFFLCGFVRLEYYEENDVYKMY